MNKEKEFENFLSISPNKLGIYLFDKKNLRNLYNDELIINDTTNYLDFNILKKFLDNNIFKIEKLSGQFIKNIILIFDDENILNLKMGIKKKNYNELITKEYLENLLIEAKDLFRENYSNQEIVHMIVNKYYINNKSYALFEKNLKGEYLALEIEFKSISDDVIYDLNKVLENYQIKINKFIDGAYVKNFFKDDADLSEMSHRILNGYKENEDTLMAKNPKKLAFFEKFFQLFS